VALALVFAWQLLEMPEPQFNGMAACGDPALRRSRRDSLMNICFLRALTNIRIGDKNPLTYFRDFQSNPGFDGMLERPIPAI
jgi:hypothetical protein